MLENQKINIKIKLAALWTSVMFCYVYGDYFELYVPDKVNSLLTGESILNSPMMLVIAAMVLVIPSLMISLSLLLKPKLSRIINIVFGFIFSLMMLLIGINSLTPWYGFYAMLAFIECAITLTIVRMAWLWPKENVK